MHNASIIKISATTKSRANLFVIPDKEYSYIAIAKQYTRISEQMIQLMVWTFLIAGLISKHHTYRYSYVSSNTR